MKEELLYRLPGGTVARLKMKSVGEILRDKGLSQTGDVQQFHTANVLRRITRYMPFRTGMTIKTTIVQTDINRPEIVTNTPYAKYLYYGKTMTNHKTGQQASFIPGVGYRHKKGAILKVSPKDIVYTKDKNRAAGPYWDRALMANEGQALAADLQRYIDRKK